MNRRLLGVLALIFWLTADSARAETVDLDTCTDAAGGVVPGVADPALGVLVRAGQQGGQRVIRYNPGLLPDLSATARQFFFAHECARVALGARPGAVWAADCAAAEMLRGGVPGEGVAPDRLQAKLVFSDEDWKLLPGPPRRFDFGACPRQTAIAIPRNSPPSAAQAAWDACVRQCGDRLFQCQGKCRGEGCGACQGDYDRCAAGCPGR